MNLLVYERKGLWYISFVRIKTRLREKLEVVIPTSFKLSIKFSTGLSSGAGTIYFRQLV